MNQKVINKCLKIAYELKEENKNRCKHCTFVIKKNTILAVGVNKRDKTHPVAKRFGHRFENIHSEIDACTRFAIDYSKVYLVNIRLNKWGEIKMSKPCICCTGWLTTLGVKKVIYSTESGFKVLKLF